MVEQYPDSIVITVTTDGTQDSNGDYQPPLSVSHTYKCRAESNDSGRRVTVADGTYRDYGFICYMAPSGIIIPYDCNYVLTKADGSIFTGRVKKPSNGQLNTRLWI